MAVHVSVSESGEDLFFFIRIEFYPILVTMICVSFEEEMASKHTKIYCLRWQSFGITTNATVAN